MRARATALAALALAAALGATAQEKPMPEFRIASPAFAEGAPIPSRHAYRAENLSPALSIEGVPAGAKSLALIVDDPDAPAGTWVHWLVANLPPGAAAIPEGKLPEGAVAGKNDFGTVAWGGPAPPSGTHRYYFRLVALDAKLDLKPGFTRAQLEGAMKGHVLRSAQAMGTYSAR
jgi:Raf kinase inhibitor-like YbhB/YbcL family protein